MSTHLHRFSPDFHIPVRVDPNEKCLVENCEFRMKDIKASIVKEEIIEESRKAGRFAIDN